MRVYELSPSSGPEARLCPRAAQLPSRAAHSRPPARRYRRGASGSGRRAARGSRDCRSRRRGEPRASMPGRAVLSWSVPGRCGSMWGARAATVPRWCRALRGSAALGGSRDLLKKMLRKNKKKFWYDSPTLGSKMMCKPTKLASLMKDDRTKTRKEDNIRCRILNSLIHKAVAEMMTTCEVNQELYDLKLEICKVSLASNFSACRVYWNPAATVEKESYIESVLRKSAPRIRYLLTSQQILGNVPPIVFVKDKEAAAVKEIEELLSNADFGPPEEAAASQNDSSKLFSSATQSSDSPMRSNLFGIDHELLNKQIMDYKRLKVSRDIESIAWTEEQEKQLSKLQKKMKKKKTRDPPDDDITPQKYLLDRYEADYWGDNTESVLDYELEDEFQEEVNELEADDGKTLSKPTDKLK
ncbi:putative ribosome-binding factor A, mitochondrial [Grus americana]|uniref:putative ribosome-binding factor A, mitochondrial n=1 Tax=Grus americana TaxID=9117 RepID=UPI0024080F7F|nr:putative ribosome-binding factor A, mitochondrial [Grus americana]